jgi:hypothetical protein
VIVRPDSRRDVALDPPIRFAPDSLVEGDGFELPVPQQIRSHFRASSPVSHDRVDGPYPVIFFAYAHAREGKASKSASFARVAISLITLTH